MAFTSNNIIVTTAILCRDNLIELVKTLDSVLNQSIIKLLFVEVLIIDGSKSDQISDHIKNLNTDNPSIEIRYIDSNKLGIFGIYPSMNLALDMARGTYIHFLNSGDTLFDWSLYGYAFNYCEQQSNPCCFFGQAIIHGKYFRWIFPDIGSRSINLWLKSFEPNHQAMLVLTEWARLYNRFRLDAPIGADAVWKRMAISETTIYFPSTVVNFYLGGQSSSYTKKRFKTRYNESWRSPFQKFLEVIKFLLFRSSFLAESLQMFKNKFISLLFKLFR